MLQPPEMGRASARARSEDLHRQAARHNRGKRAQPRSNWVLTAWHRWRYPPFTDAVGNKWVWADGRYVKPIITTVEEEI